MVRLILPQPEYLDSYLEGCREYKEKGVHTYALHDPDNFETWKSTIFESFARKRVGEGLPEGYVPCTVFWLVEDGKWLGISSLRHRLTPALERFGGHIGYAVRWSEWGKGYGTQILRLTLPEADKMGIMQARVSCDDDNIGSRRIIEKNGGVFLDIVDNTIDGVYHRTRRYDVPTGLSQENL